MSLTNAILLLVTALTLSAVGRAQTPPAVPPTSVIVEGRRAAQITGRTLTGDSSTAYVEADGMTGHTIWVMRWNAVAPVQGYVEVKVDEQRSKAVAYRNETDSLAHTAAFEAGQAVTVSEAQAVAKLDALVAALPVTAGDWRTEHVELTSHGGFNGAPGEPFWYAIKRRYQGGRFVSTGRFSVFINPYDGTVYSWDYQGQGVFLPPSGPVLTPSRAQPVAVNAFIQYAGSVLRPSDSTTPSPPTDGVHEPYWNRISPDSPLLRLHYVFYFPLPEIGNPDHEPEGEGGQWRPSLLFRLVMDAETAEILSIQQVRGGGSFRKPGKVKFSPRVRLMQFLAEDRAALPLLKAVAGGKPVTASKPGPQAKRFTRVVGGKSRTFALNVSTRRLTWESEPGKWAGVALTEAQTEEARRFLSAAPAVPVPGGLKTRP